METTFLKFFLWTRKMKGWHTHRKKFNEGLKIHLSLSELDSKISPKFFSRQNSIRRRRKKFWHPQRKKATSFSLENQKWLMKKFFFQKFFSSMFSFGHQLCIFDNPAEVFPPETWNFFPRRPGRKEKIDIFQAKVFYLKILPWTRRPLVGRRCKKLLTKVEKVKKFWAYWKHDKQRKAFLFKNNSMFPQIFPIDTHNAVLTTPSKKIARRAENSSLTVESDTKISPKNFSPSKRPCGHAEWRFDIPTENKTT